mmetsp:Transcript_10572/g.20955  ORF Transcript_10572/g.20955 Transcript_10572/m.20955 type:complete len:114 (-) Transcript_10572:2-343(-)
MSFNTPKMVLPSPASQTAAGDEDVEGEGDVAAKAEMPAAVAAVAAGSVRRKAERNILLLILLWDYYLSSPRFYSTLTLILDDENGESDWRELDGGDPELHTDSKKNGKGCVLF